MRAGGIAPPSPLQRKPDIVLEKPDHRIRKHVVLIARDHVGRVHHVRELRVRNPPQEILHALFGHDVRQLPAD